MKYFGAHVSAAGGVENAPRNARAIGATAFALFTKNQRQWSAPALTAEQVAAFRAACDECGYAPAQILPHDSYLINLGHPDDEALEKSRRAFEEEMARCEALGLDRLNFHPGSHVRQGVEAGVERIAEHLNAILRPEQSTTVLLETMAGKGSEVGGSFAELRAILDRVRLPEKLGVCLDTCHVHDAGYDICGDLDGVLEEFDRVVGLERLRAVHLNDSKNPLGSRKDRHEKLGLGTIGLEALARVVNHPALRGLPFYLETPNDLDGYAREIACVKGLAGEGKKKLTIFSKTY